MILEPITLQARYQTIKDRSNYRQSKRGLEIQILQWIMANVVINGKYKEIFPIAISFAF